MAGAGEFLGGVAGAAPGLLKLPIDVSDNVLQWEKFKAGLHEGGIVKAFPPHTNLLDGLKERIAAGVLKETRISGCDVEVSLVPDGERHRIIGFRSPRSKAKMALRLEWEHFYASITVKAKDELVYEYADGSTRTIQPGEVVREVERYGGFVDNVGVEVHGTSHIHGKKYAFVVGGSVISSIESTPGNATQRVKVQFTLAPHVVKSAFQGGQEVERNLGKDPRSFAYTITGDKQVIYSDSRRKKLDVPTAEPAVGEHFLADELVRLHKSAAMENQGVLWSLDKKGSDREVDVVAVLAEDLKVRTDDAAESAAPAPVKNLKVFLVIGDHTDNLSTYLKRYPTHKTGQLSYSSKRTHGTWWFTGDVKDLEPQIRAEVERQFALRGGDRTKKHIRFR